MSSRTRLADRTRRRGREIGFWVGRSESTFSTTSSTGRQFFVVAKRGTLRLSIKNLGELAFVF